MRIVFPAVGIEGRNVKKRIPHKENKGITVVAKPSTKVLGHGGREPRDGRRV